MLLEAWFKRLRILKQLPSSYWTSLWGMWKLYDRLERQTNRFRRNLKMKCQSGCGRCCQYPFVESTVIEMIPIAAHLLATQQEERFLLNAKQQQYSGECVFYQKNLTHEGRGRCLIYPFRPLVCRLFGFSLSRDKNNQYEIVTCSTIKNNFMKEWIKAKVTVNRIPKSFAVMQDYKMKLFGLHPQLARDLHPINTAFKMAVERVGMLRQMVKD